MDHNEEHRSYFIETYGCQMNIAESNVLDAEFLKRGFRAANSPEDADIVILNTCSVRKTAENRIWGRLGFYKHLKQSKDLKLIITGCMAERLKEELIEKEPSVDLVIGTNDKTDIIHFLSQDDSVSDEYSFASSYYRDGEYSAFVPIMNGCNNFCAYCIVPYVRGREISRKADEVVEEIRSLTAKGVKEVTLLGQNVNSYAYTCEDGSQVDFPALLRRIIAEVPELTWLRFMSAHPKDFPDELIELISRERAICSHIHLPMQSGSTGILKAMNRKYDADTYYGIIERLKTADSEMTFTTDIMVGFPGEREEDLEDTLGMMRRSGFSESYMYYYNPREGTASTRLPDQLDDRTKLARLQQVIDLQRELTNAYKKTTMGKTVTVLCDSISKKDTEEFVGHTEHNDRIVFPKDDSVSIGDIVELKVTDVIGTTLRGEYHVC